MLSNLKGGFFFFFAAMITFMGVVIWFVVPETKGRTLEGMDQVFGSAYAETEGLGVEMELSEYRKGIVPREKQAGNKEEEGEAVADLEIELH